MILVVFLAEYLLVGVMKLLREMRFCRRKRKVGHFYKDHFSKLEKDITALLNEFVPGNLLHISKLKSYQDNVAEQNEQIKGLNNEILELVQIEDFDKEMNS